PHALEVQPGLQRAAAALRPRATRGVRAAPPRAPRDHDPRPDEPLHPPRAEAGARPLVTGRIGAVADAVLIYADSFRSADRRHAVPLAVPDPILYAESNGSR